MPGKWRFTDVERDPTDQWVREFTRTQEWTCPPYVPKKSPLGFVSMVKVQPFQFDDHMRKSVSKCFARLVPDKPGRLRPVAVTEAAVAAYHTDCEHGFDQRGGKSSSAEQRLSKWADEIKRMKEATSALRVEDRNRLRRASGIAVEVDLDQLESLLHRLHGSCFIAIHEAKAEKKPTGRPKTVAERRLVYRLGLIWHEFRGSFSHERRASRGPWYEFVGVVMPPLIGSSGRHFATEIAKEFSRLQKSPPPQT